MASVIYADTVSCHGDWATVCGVRVKGVKDVLIFQVSIDTAAHIRVSRRCLLTDTCSMKLEHCINAELTVGVNMTFLSFHFYKNCNYLF